MAVITVRAKDLTVAPIWATPYLLFFFFLFFFFSIPFQNR